MLPELTSAQFSLVANFLSFAVATLGGAAIFFLAAPAVSKKYRLATVVGGVVCAIATYHYVRIFNSFTEAYTLKVVGGVGSYLANGQPFNDFYRYADWFITVPLLMVELVAVMSLSKAEGRGLLLKLVIATALMIGLGYPGEISQDPGTRWIWWVASMIPFVYTLFILFVQLGAVLKTQPAEVRGLISLARLVTLVTWSFYPLAYALKTALGTSAAGEVAIQVGYSVADITAKAGFGLVVYLIARTKSELEEARHSDSDAARVLVGSRTGM